MVGTLSPDDVTGLQIELSTDAERTTPPEFTQTAACDFDAAVVDMFGATCNVVLSDMQRTRVGFSIKEGGLGLRTIADKNDAAYIASRHAAHFLCTQNQTLPQRGLKPT